MKKKIHVEEDNLTSVIHHSNGFGVVLKNDRNLNEWNYTLGNSNKNPLTTNQRSTISFGMNYRLNNSPFIFEYHVD